MALLQPLADQRDSEGKRETEREMERQKERDLTHIQCIIHCIMWIICRPRLSYLAHCPARERQILYRQADKVYVCVCVYVINRSF